MLVILGGAALALQPRVKPAWYYRLKYYTSARGGVDKCTAARRVVQSNVFYAQRYTILVDMSQSSLAPRLAVYDLRSNRYVFRTRVMHGQGSGGSLANKFSNQAGSKMTSLGRYVVVDTYLGRFERAYRLAGLDPTNDQALARSVVLHHSASFYPGHIGRSYGCPAVSVAALQAMRPYVQVGTLLWIYR